MGFIHQILFAGSLAACSSLRAFITLLIICWATRTGNIDPKFLNRDIYPFFAKNDIFFQILILLALLEAFGDKMPTFSHFLDGLNLILRPAAGVLASLSVLTFEDAILNYVIAIALGAVITLPMQSILAGCRILLQSPESSRYNFTLSLTEDTLATGSALFSIFKPEVAFPSILLIVFLILNAFKKWRVNIIMGDEGGKAFPNAEKLREESELMEIKRLKKIKQKIKKLK